jgi:hypothetical protein
MPNYDVAHIREQGIDLVIVPVESSFGTLPQADQEAMIRSLQRCANSAGLAGTVVPVWDAGGGRMGFMAPANWHQYFSSINMSVVAVNVNHRLSCA